MLRTHSKRKKKSSIGSIIALAKHSREILKEKGMTGGDDQD